MEIGIRVGSGRVSPYLVDDVGRSFHIMSNNCFCFVLSVVINDGYLFSFNHTLILMMVRLIFLFYIYFILPHNCLLIQFR